MKARESFAAGRYDEALEIFAKLYAETLNPIYLRNIGRCHQKLKQPDKAIDAFHDYLPRAARRSPPTRRRRSTATSRRWRRCATSRRASSRRRRRRSLVAPVAPRPAAFRRRSPRGRRPVTPPSRPRLPGTRAAGHPPGADQQQPRRHAGGAAAAPQPESSGPVYTRWWFWTIIGAAVVGGVVTAVALSSGTTKPSCPPTPEVVCERPGERSAPGRCRAAPLAGDGAARWLRGSLGGCGEKDSLIVVTAQAYDNSTTGLHTLVVTAGSTHQTFQISQAITDGPVTVGLYVPSSLTGSS